MPCEVGSCGGGDVIVPVETIEGRSVTSCWFLTSLVEVRRGSLRLVSALFGPGSTAVGRVRCVRLGVTLGIAVCPKASSASALATL